MTVCQKSFYTKDMDTPVNFWPGYFFLKTRLCKEKRLRIPLFVGYLLPPKKNIKTTKKNLKKTKTNKTQKNSSRIF